VEQRNVNPWAWQDQYGFSQAVEVSGAQRVLYCAGQTSTGADGGTLHPHDMGGQTAAALDNLETVLREAGMGQRAGAAGIQPASTLLGVARLAFDDLVIEIEATAVA
jgi:enamine deaminase RidA (YjgF/YER057c/UK114 family)